jgi:putative membrane protein
MMTKAWLLGGVVLALTGSPTVAAQQPTTAAKANQTMAAGKAPDAAFMMKAATAGMAEVELGRLAADKAGSDDVKKFGQRMVDDHSKANDELKTLAQNKNVTLPTAIDPHAKAVHDKLSTMTGAAFDRTFMQTMVADHKKAVNDFRMASKSAKDADVKGWAAKTLPTLEAHLKMAQSATTAVGTTGDKTKKP